MERGEARVKFGADIRYNDVNNNAAFDSKGTFTFDNLQAYMNNNGSGSRRRCRPPASRSPRSGRRSSSRRTISAYSALTLNLGLRYERSDVPLGLFGATDPQVAAQWYRVRRRRTTTTGRRAWASRTVRTGPTGSSATARPSSAAAGVGYDVIFYNLLTVKGQQPARRHADRTTFSICIRTS